MGELLARRTIPTLEDLVFFQGFVPWLLETSPPARQRLLLYFPLNRWVAPSASYANLNLKNIFLAKAAVEVFVRILDRGSRYSPRDWDTDST